MPADYQCRQGADTVSEWRPISSRPPRDQMQSNSDTSRLRVLVGYLGEHHQANWWSSSFLGHSSEAFLAPIFGNAAANARVVGVTEAARRVHDDAIGVGRTFHLFRLPETLEQELHRTLSTSESMAIPELVDAAIEEMRALSSLPPGASGAAGDNENITRTRVASSRSWHGEWSMRAPGWGLPCGRSRGGHDGPAA